MAAVVRPTRASQWGGVFLFSVFSSPFLHVLGLLSTGAVLYYLLSAILESSDFVSLFSCDYLSVYVYVRGLCDELITRPEEPTDCDASLCVI